MVVTNQALELIATFLDTPTTSAWINEACRRLPDLLIDQANCEIKAASTALGFIYRYPNHTVLVQRMSRLAREELRHFEQVKKLMEEMSIPFRRLSASRYAGQLRRAVRREEPGRLLDMLLVGALIEARSCERFAALVPHLPKKLSDFYAELLTSEARHFEHYLTFAKDEVSLSEEEFNVRVDELKMLEAKLISEPDNQFRFHSGDPS